MTIAATEAIAPKRQPLTLLFAYALAWAGGCVAYTPFLTVLLPQRLTVLAGSADVRWLALASTIGALTASLSNIFWGWLSDRLGCRLALVALGLLAFACANIAVARSSTVPILLIAIMAWQLSLNLFLAPLAAYAADWVPSTQTGSLGGLLAFGPGIAALSILGVALVPSVLGFQLAFVVVATTVAAVPLFSMRKPVLARIALARVANSVPRSNQILARLWFARLTVQVAEGLLFVFLYYALRQMSGGELSLGRYAITNATAQLCAIPVALIVGRQSDRTGRRKQPLLVMIALIALGLGTMASAQTWTQAVIGYVVFVIGSNCFLSLHSTFAMQQLSNPQRYGRDLGVFNLTNTLPALVTPLLAAAVIGSAGYAGLLFGLMAVMIIPAILIMRLDLP